jgi:predicted enzyme related to lactoylglutathione lyase
MPRPIHFDFSADNPERAVAFYSDVFGWQFQKWEGAGPMEYWLVTTGDSSEPGIDGGLSRRQDGVGTGLMNTISVPSLDEYLERVPSAGGTVAMPRMPIPGVGWWATFADPEGNHFGILEPDSQAA